MLTFFADWCLFVVRVAVSLQLDFSFNVVIMMVGTVIYVTFCAL